MFNLNTAILLSKLCVEVYKDDVTSISLPPGYELIQFIDNKETDTQVLIAKTSNVIAIVFRGIDRTRDLKYAVQIIKSKYPPSSGILRKPRVHSGYLKEHLSVKDQIYSHLEDFLKRDKYEIYVTGHSLGAALACLFAFDLQREKGIQSKLYNFGGSKLGNKHFVKLYNASIHESYRLVNDADWGPRLRVAGYKHVNTEVLITNDGKIIVNPSKQGVRQELHKAISLLTGEAFSDHLIEYYLDLLIEIKKNGGLSGIDKQ